MNRNERKGQIEQMMDRRKRIQDGETNYRNLRKLWNLVYGQLKSFEAASCISSVPYVQHLDISIPGG